MKKFKFALEKVLEVKEIEEKVIQRDLLLLQNKIYETQKKITSIRERITDEKKLVNLIAESVTKSTQIMTHYKYIDSLNRDIDICTENLRVLYIRENELKERLLEKTREKKAIERLKEIKYEEFRKEYNKEQQNFIDDISIQNHRLKVENA